MSPAEEVLDEAVHLPVLAEEVDHPVLLEQLGAVDGEGVRVVVRDSLVLAPEPGVLPQHRVRQVQAAQACCYDGARARVVTPTCPAAPWPAPGQCLPPWRPPGAS